MGQHADAVHTYLRVRSDNKVARHHIRKLRRGVYVSMFCQNEKQMVQGVKSEPTSNNRVIIQMKASSQDGRADMRVPISSSVGNETNTQTVEQVNGPCCSASKLDHCLLFRARSFCPGI